MKRVFGLLLALLLLLPGCAREKPKELSVYTFSGSDGQISVVNGVAVFSEQGDVFDGGRLCLGADFPQDVTAYTASFYVQSSSEQRTLLSNSVVDETGGTLQPGEDLGRRATDGAEGYLGRTTDWQEELRNGLSFVLTITQKSGEQRTYEIPMMVECILG